MKKSNLYDYVLKMIDGEEIDDFNLGISSKSVLHQIKKYSDEDIEFQSRLLKSYKINISAARRMILDKQSEESGKSFKKEIVESKNIDMVLDLLENMTKDARSKIYSKLKQMIVDDRPNQHLTEAQKKAIDIRVEKLYEKSGGEIPKYIFHHRSFHE